MSDANGRLYVVATPIGHLGDLTRRAEDVLKSVQIVAAEDTRRTRVLLDHIGHRAPELISLHEHNEETVSQRLLDRLEAGQDIALVSDAGTPLINDPGFTLIASAHKRGIHAVPIPGSSSITAALSVCPLPVHPFRYVGFLPSKKGARHKALGGWMKQPEALVFLESPRRIPVTLEDLATLTERQIFIARELTKKHETLYVGQAGELREVLGDEVRGELVVIVEAAGEDVSTDLSRTDVLEALLTELSPAQAARIGARILNEKKSGLYDLALRLKGDS